MRPRSYFDLCTGKEGAFLIGEAAGLISPSSLEGISFAINSARILSEVFANQNKSKEKEYRKKLLDCALKCLEKLSSHLLCMIHYCEN